MAHMALRFRNTFIEAVDAVEASPARRGQRQRSAPAAARRESGEQAPVDAEAFAGERERVGGLSALLGELWQEADASAGDGAAAAMAFFAAPRRIAPPAPAPPRTSRVAADARLRAKASSEASMTASMTASTSGGDMSCRASERNEASQGHPYLCSRPCLYFAAGACTNRDACAFCHMPHPKRAAHMNKRHREVLQAMPPPRARALLLLVLWDKVLAIDDSAGSRRAFLELARACGPSGPSTSPTRSERALVGTLGSVNVRSVLSTVQRFARGEDEQDCKAAAEDLVVHLRSCAGTP